MGILKVDVPGSAGDSYATKALTLPSSFFVEYRWAITQGTMDALDGGGGDQNTAVGLNFTANSGDGVIAADFGSTGTWRALGDFDPAYGAGVGLVIAGDTWHFIQGAYNGTTVTWKVNGTVVGSYTLASGNIDSPIQFGATFQQNIAGEERYYLKELKIGTTLGGTDIFAPVLTDLSEFDSTTNGSALSIVSDPGYSNAPMEEPGTNASGGVRVGIAFDDVTLEPVPVWTYLTDTANVVAGYEISRGGESEFEHTNPSSATVKLNDQDGVLDPTNSSGPYYGLIEPLLQIIIQLWNPVAEEWQTRFRGFIEDYDYTVEPFAHQNDVGDTVGVTRLTISCVDLEAILSAIEMQTDGAFGDTPPAQSVDNVFFDNASAHDRITQVFDNAGIPTDFYIVFTLNVNMQESVYSAGSNVMEVIQDAVDAEFPTVANRYIDRLGRMAIHGRLAKFDPDGTASDAGPSAWDFTRWKCGDGKAVAASPTDTAHIRTFAFNRGMSKVYNSALCTPNGIDIAPLLTPLADQFTKDDPSITQYGIRSWSAENLLIGAPTGNPLTAANAGTLTGNNALDETKAVADFIVANYKTPRNRITDVTFRSMPPDQEGAAANWDLLGRIDISDVVEVTVDIPGGGGLSLEPFFVEGITESCEPLNGQYANVTLAPSLSPLAYFTDPSGLDGV